MNGGGSTEQHVHNLIPLDNVFSLYHPCVRFPEVQAAVNVLRDLTSDLHRPPSWQGHHDLLDWMAFFFGFQTDNVRNQREHLVLHLANLHMRRPDPPPPADILGSFRKKLLENYEEWCSYLGVASNVVLGTGDHDLLYVSLYLLIWGESANLRFLPECICFIFHNMAMEMNRIVEKNVDETTGELSLPHYSGENGFLDRVVKPIYDAMFSEVVNGRLGIAQYAKWRNYDDFNEYFWSRRCFDDLKWPLDLSSKFFGGAGKTGFVERRSFWNLFRSFSRLWLMLILFLQGAIIVAWEGKRNPFKALSSDKDVKVRVLTVFVTWSCLELWESILDILMQYKLVSRDTLFLGISMLAKFLISISWSASFGWLYVKILAKRNEDGANKEVARFLKVALAFVLIRIWPFVLYVPCISDFFYRKKWRILMMLRSRREYIGRGLREGLLDYAKYSAFWIAVLATKFYFSYSLQILPMVNSTKQLWNLKGVDYRWHQVFDERNGAAIVLLWLPVTLIYLMDLQMWFTIYSFLVSTTVGLFSRLGEIQDIRQLKLRFGDFVRQIAYKFDLVSEEHPLFDRRNMFGFGWLNLNMKNHKVSSRIKKLESDPVMVQKFSVIWNEIITSFREEDIVSDTEVELLELPPNHSKARVICWPCFLLCNELEIAIRAADELADAPDEKLWKKICKNEYRRSAVIEVYDSIRYLLLDRIIDPNTEEHAIVAELFEEFDHAIENQIFTRKFDLSELKRIRHLIVDFLYPLTSPYRYPSARELQNLYVAVIRDFMREKRNYSGEIFGNAVKFHHTTDEIFLRSARRLLTIISSKDALQNFPRGEEAKRRVAFFSNSVFMNIPKAPSVEKMKAFSVLTPYYKEDVLYKKEQLLGSKDSGIKLVYYLQKIYQDDWENFMERMFRQGMRYESEIWTTKLDDLRLWASYRGQTLARTVRGMMYYRRTLEILAVLDSLANTQDGAPDPDSGNLSSKCESLWNHDPRFDMDTAEGSGKVSSRLEIMQNHNLPFDMDIREGSGNLSSRLESLRNHDIRFDMDATEGSGNLSSRGLSLQNHGLRFEMDVMEGSGNLSRRLESLQNYDLRFDMDVAEGSGNLSPRLESPQNHDLRFDMDATESSGNLSSRLESLQNQDLRFDMDAMEGLGNLSSRRESLQNHEVPFDMDSMEGSGNSSFRLESLHNHDLLFDTDAAEGSGNSSSRLENLQNHDLRFNMDATEGFGNLSSRLESLQALDSQPNMNNEGECSDIDDEEMLEEAPEEYAFSSPPMFVGIVEMKYTYVVACQNYERQKRGYDPGGDDILYLMKNNEAMRVAYVDTVETSRGQYEYYSVLVKYDQNLQKEVQIYRIKLPGSCMLGEGKPENQNQAIIFTRGDAVQTIDMNQDNYLEEALKMPNLLEEFDRFYGIRKPSILGLREHIFTGSVSSLAWFMSAQETGFVTSGQRVQANPLKIRMHYGHPDVFDRFWFIARGGISKATRAINICEDIFAGFNCTLRGGNITHHEYIQVDKGRDVSLDQISLFEAKIAGGSAGQLISRDIYRLGHRLDFFRMLSLFHSTVGFYFSAILVIWAIYAIQWSQVYLALSGLGAATNNGSIRSAFTAVVGVQLIQLVQYTGLPMIVEDALEHGLLSALKDFFVMQMQLSSVFFTFSMGTRGHYFGRTILHGGAKYLGTGRGMVLHHRSFAEIYRLYARSHFVKAIELSLLITVYVVYSPSDYGTYSFIDTNISFWFLVISWALSPFIFNPCGFDWLNTVNDFDDFMRWIWFPSGVFVKPEQSWESWWYKEQRHLRHTGFAGKILEVILNTRFFFFQYGIVYRMNLASGNTSLSVYLLSWIFVAAAFVVVMVLSHADNKYAAKAHIYYRLVQFVTLAVVFFTLFTLFWFTKLKVVDLFSSLLLLIPTGWGLVSIAQVFRLALERTVLWNIVVSVARIYDLLFGVIIMVPVAIISWLPGFSRLQTRMLFNDAYVRGLQIYEFYQGKKLQKDH